MQALRAIEAARETLRTAYPGLEPSRNIEALEPLERARHLLWMCGEIEGFLSQDLDKAMRWLGFVQGALWVMGLRGIDAMRRDNA